jgi:2-dehydro-3-deoxygluconokinase
MRKRDHVGPDVVSIGEPLLEFNAVQVGSLREVRQYEVGWGGDTSNFAIAVSRLGTSVGYVCRLGADDFGQIFLDLWEREGVDTLHVIQDGGASTGIYFISRRGAEHSFTYYRKDSAASRLSPSDIPEDYITGARLVHVSGISQAISSSACDAVFSAINAARKGGTLVSYDPNIRLKLWGMGRARAIVRETIGLADLVFPTLEEGRMLTGRDEAEAVASDLIEYGPKVVVLKMGREGALLTTADQLERFKPFSVTVVDTTGAGDAFDAAFVVGYLEGQSLPDCVCFANATAALTTTGWGAVAPIPRRPDVDTLLAGASGRVIS